MKVKIFLIIVIISLFMLLNNSKTEKQVFTEQRIWPGSKLIGHAMFGIDGTTYTNSKEAFYNGYQQGIRTFEIDLGLTSDNKLILNHDWERNNRQYIPTEKSFLKEKINNKYTTLSINDVLLLLKIFPDIWIITDSKYTEKDQIIKEFQELVSSAKKLNLISELDRFVIQLYYQEMYSTIESIYHFNNYLYTMYITWDGKYNTFNNICQWGKDKLRGIVLYEEWYNVNLLNITKNNNLDLYLHTVNNLDKAKKYLKEGVKGIYTDFISQL